MAEKQGVVQRAESMAQLVGLTLTLASPTGDCVAMGKRRSVVILSEAKNLIISTESTIEILRLSPQNDIKTQSPG